MGVKRIVRYVCTSCRAQYLTRQEAEACAAREETPVCKVGDIVLAGGMRFGWFDGEKSWIARSVEPRRHEPQPASGRMHEFYYLVTAIEPEGHRLRYYLATRAMTGRSGYRAGWTTADGGHFTPRVVDPRPELPGEAELMNEKPRNLL